MTDSHKISNLMISLAWHKSGLNLVKKKKTFENEIHEKENSEIEV